MFTAEKMTKRASRQREKNIRSILKSIKSMIRARVTEGYLNVQLTDEPEETYEIVKQYFTVRGFTVECRHNGLYSNCDIWWEV